jgi:O-antigen/teichoic acid export membrane protein
VFELGFSIVILQLASHERAHLSLAPDGTISGDPIAHERLASVLQKSMRWYTAGAVFLGCALLPAGFYFFADHRHPGQTVAWRIPWCMVALATTLTFQIDPILSFLEGCGFVANIARLRLAQAILGGVLMWTVLSTRHGLFAPAMMIVGQVVVAAVWLFRRRALLLGLLRYKTGVHRIVWSREVWPFQWRIAVSWICGYFIFQLYTPVLFAYRGPVEAGQMGMSLSIAGALSAVSVAWVNTKAAPFGALIARKKYEELDRIFFQAMRHSLAVYMAGALAVWGAVVYLNLAGIRFAHRVLNPMLLGFLLLGGFLNVVVIAQSVYLRAHKQEKYLTSAILSAIMLGSSTYFFGRQYGAAGMVIGYITIAVTFGIGYNTYIFLKYRREWHSEPSTEEIALQSR